ncbi:MAG: RNA methyltransferase [Tenericutes bacterium]|nr:RNA methyltransferase [Mycoplasmatota bacterium]
MLISSKDNKKIKKVRSLLDKKESIKNNSFIVEGENLVIEAYKNNLLVELYVLENTKIDFEFEYDNVTLDVMKTMSDLKSTPRMIGVVSMNNNHSTYKKVVILDNIQDPGNAGTIIRNAVAFGVDTIVFSKDSVSPYNEKVLRATGGMIFNINIIIDDIEVIIKKLKESNICIIGTSLKTKTFLQGVEKFDEYAIILGNEGNGVSNKIISMCDKVIKINMSDSCESLNVGVASGIILHYLYKE